VGKQSKRSGSGFFCEAMRLNIPELEKFSHSTSESWFVCFGLVTGLFNEQVRAFEVRILSGDLCVSKSWENCDDSNSMPLLLNEDEK
jgi:hypothetical protein